MSETIQALNFNNWCFWSKKNKLIKLEDETIDAFRIYNLNRLAEAFSDQNLLDLIMFTIVIKKKIINIKKLFKKYDEIIKNESLKANYKQILNTLNSGKVEVPKNVEETFSFLDSKFNFFNGNISDIFQNMIEIMRNKIEIRNSYCCEIKFILQYLKNNNKNNYFTVLPKLIKLKKNNNLKKMAEENYNNNNETNLEQEAINKQIMKISILINKKFEPNINNDNKYIFLKTNDKIPKNKLKEVIIDEIIKKNFTKKSFNNNNYNTILIETKNPEEIIRKCYEIFRENNKYYMYKTSINKIINNKDLNSKERKILSNEIINLNNNKIIKRIGINNIEKSSFKIEIDEMDLIDKNNNDKIEDNTNTNNTNVRKNINEDNIDDLLKLLDDNIKENRRLLNYEFDDNDNEDEQFDNILEPNIDIVENNKLIINNNTKINIISNNNINKINKQLSLINKEQFSIQSNNNINNTNTNDNSKSKKAKNDIKIISRTNNIKLIGKKRMDDNLIKFNNYLMEKMNNIELKMENIIIQNGINDNINLKDKNNKNDKNIQLPNINNINETIDNKVNKIEKILKLFENNINSIKNNRNWNNELIINSNDNFNIKNNKLLFNNIKNIICNKNIKIFQEINNVKIIKFKEMNITRNIINQNYLNQKEYLKFENLEDLKNKIEFKHNYNLQFDIDKIINIKCRNIESNKCNYEIINFNNQINSIPPNDKKEINISKFNDKRINNENYIGLYLNDEFIIWFYKKNWKIIQFPNNMEDLIKFNCIFDNTIINKIKLRGKNNITIYGKDLIIINNKLKIKRKINNHNIISIQELNDNNATSIIKNENINYENDIDEEIIIENDCNKLFNTDIRLFNRDFNIENKYEINKNDLLNIISIISRNEDIQLIYNKLDEIESNKILNDKYIKSEINLIKKEINNYIENKQNKKFNKKNLEKNYNYIFIKDFNNNIDEINNYINENLNHIIIQWKSLKDKINLYDMNIIIWKKRKRLSNMDIDLLINSNYINNKKRNYNNMINTYIKDIWLWIKSKINSRNKKININKFQSIDFYELCIQNNNKEFIKLNPIFNKFDEDTKDIDWYNFNTKIWIDYDNKKKILKDAYNSINSIIKRINNIKNQRIKKIINSISILIIIILWGQYNNNNLNDKVWIYLNICNILINIFIENEDNDFLIRFTNNDYIIERFNNQFSCIEIGILKERKIGTKNSNNDIKKEKNLSTALDNIINNNNFLKENNKEIINGDNNLWYFKNKYNINTLLLKKSFSNKKIFKSFGKSWNNSQDNYEIINLIKKLIETNNEYYNIKNNYKYNKLEEEIICNKIIEDNKTILREYNKYIFKNRITLKDKFDLTNILIKKIKKYIKQFWINENNFTINNINNNLINIINSKKILETKRNNIINDIIIHNIKNNKKQFMNNNNNNIININKNNFINTNTNNNIHLNKNNNDNNLMSKENLTKNDFNNKNDINNNDNKQKINKIKVSNTINTDSNNIENFIKEKDMKWNEEDEEVLQLLLEEEKEDNK